MESFRNKLIICACALVPFARVAQAAQLVVFEEPLQWNQEISAELAVNRELGRAWVDVRVRSTDPGDGPQDLHVIPKAIEGLHYDQARKQVLYRAGTENVVCAEDATFLWSTYLKPTGRCLLTSRSEQHKTDDGFRIREQTVAKVVFLPQTSALAGEPGGGAGEAAMDQQGVSRSQRDAGSQRAAKRCHSHSPQRQPAQNCRAAVEMIAADSCGRLPQA